MYNSDCSSCAPEPVDVLRVAKDQGTIIFDKCQTTEWNKKEPKVSNCQTFATFSEQEQTRLQNLPGGYCRSISRAEYVAIGTAFVVYGVMGGWIGLVLADSIFPNAAVSVGKWGVAPLLLTGGVAAALIYFFESHACDEVMRPFVASLYNHLSEKVADSYVLVNVPGDFWVAINQLSVVK